MNKIVLRFFCLTLSIASALSAFSSPATKSLIKMKQPDGSYLNVYLKGDEHHHFYLTEDEYLLEIDADGFFCYANIDADNKTFSLKRASNIGQRTQEEVEMLSKLDKKAQMETMQAQSIRMRISAEQERPKGATLTAWGSPKVLVLLVGYPDYPLTFGKTDFEELLNQSGYNKDGAIGSARDYFADSSNDQFTPQFDVYGPYTPSKGYEHYGYGSPPDKATELIVEICQQADNQIDFSQYDLDGDGDIDNVYMIYAGYSQSDGGPSTSIWPHHTNIKNRNINLDGVRLASYACSSELTGGSGARLTGIGPFCHEFSHVLGLPDVYSTAGGGVFTPRDWDVMDIGNHAENGRVPPSYSAYERYFFGWLNPIELTDPQNVKLENLSENRTAYIINTGNKTATSDEFFLFENRQLNGFDAALPGHGMLVWHINYAESRWTNNQVNVNEEAQSIDLEEADPKYRDFRETNPFPGESNKTRFSDESTPNMRLWSGVGLNKPITGIREVDGVIYFKFRGGVPDDSYQIKTLEASGVEAYSFIANWERHPAITDYVIDVYQKNGESISYVEGYDSYFVGDVTECFVMGLKPEQDYYYVVRGINTDFVESINSNEMKVTSSDKPFDILTPQGFTAQNVSDKSFTINWDGMENATYYSISVTKKARKELNFDNSVIAQGWVVSNPTFNHFTFGKKTPSMTMNSTLNYIQSYAHVNGILSYGFWYKGVYCDPKNTLSFHSFYDGSWHEVSTTISSITNDANQFELSWDDLENSQCVVLFASTMQGVGNVLIDDVYVVIHGDSTDYIDYNVGNLTSFTVRNLEPETEYICMLTAYQDDIKSRKAVPLFVTTTKHPTGTQNLNNEQKKLDYQLIDNTLYIKTKENVSIYNALGQLIFNDIPQQEGINLMQGIYVVHSQGVSIKLHVK